MTPRYREFLVVTIDDERYAIALESVQRVLAAVAVTRVPGLPAVVVGLVDVHGSLTPVFDLRRRLGLPPRPVDPADHFVLASAAERRVLLHVDTVSDVVRIDDAQLDEHDAAVATAEHIAGIIRLPDGLVLVHDLARFLSAGESTQLERALSAGGGDPQARA